MRDTQKVVTAVRSFCEAACAAVVAAIAIGITVDVLARNAGLGGVSWMLDTVEYGLFVLLSVGLIPVSLKGRHVSVDLLVQAAPAAWQDRIGLLVSLLEAVIFLALGSICVAAALNAYASGSMIYKAVSIPEWVPLALISPTLLFLGVASLVRLVLRALPSSNTAG